MSAVPRRCPPPFLNVALHPQAIVLALQAGDLGGRASRRWRGLRRRLRRCHGSRGGAQLLHPPAQNRIPRTPSSFATDPPDRPSARSNQGDTLTFESIRKRPSFASLSIRHLLSPSEPTTGVHSFGGGSGLLRSLAMTEAGPYPVFRTPPSCRRCRAAPPVLDRPDRPSPESRQPRATRSPDR